MAARWAGIDSEISIHALREEGDAIPPQATGGILIFLSTPSARRATRREDDESRRDKISIHALREEGDGAVGTAALRRGISIHALREEGDPLCCPADSCCRSFLSTPSARRATCSFAVCFQGHDYFYPRPPRGGRPNVWSNYNEYDQISIHALREEGDKSPFACMNGFCNFYPRPPRGGRRLIWAYDRAVYDFYPRPPRGGRQQKQRQNLYFLINYTTFCTNLEEL